MLIRDQGTGELKPFVPPPCPVVRENGEVDITKTRFVLVADEISEPNGLHTVWAYFAQDMIGPEIRPDDEVRYLRTDDLELSIDDPLYKLAAREHASGSATERGIGTSLCKRVAECHGVIDGECWALGSTALREVLQAAVDGEILKISS